MILTVRYFFERSDADYEDYKKPWEENQYRMVFFQHVLGSSNQSKICSQHITDAKDILAVRFESHKRLKKNLILNDILQGNGFVVSENKIWYPKEVWIYH